MIIIRSHVLFSLATSSTLAGAAGLFSPVKGQDIFVGCVGWIDPMGAHKEGALVWLLFATISSARRIPGILKGGLTRGLWRHIRESCQARQAEWHGASGPIPSRPKRHYDDNHYNQAGQPQQQLTLERVGSEREGT